MGIFDFLSDLSKARTKDELGLGGMRSLLGTRGAAPESKRGEEMMRRTSTDNLPGYFNPETREYVPWYVDLFDGGGLNKSEGLLASAQKTPSAVDMLKTNGAPVQRASQMAPGPLGPFGGAGPNIPEGPLGPFGGAGPRISGGDPRQMGGASGYGQTGVSPLDPFGGAGPAIASPRTPELPISRDTAGVVFSLDDETGQDIISKRLPMLEPNMPGRFIGSEDQLSPAIATPQEPTVPSLPNIFGPAPQASVLDTLRENAYSIGPIEAYRNALNNRPDIPPTQPFAGRDDTPRLSEMQNPMMQHPAFPQFVDIMKRMGNESVLQNPDQALFVFNNYLKQIGYN